MQVTETSAEGLKHEYRVVVDADDVAGRITARLEQLRKTIRLPGFRPGMVPVSLLRQRYGQSLMGEVLDEAVNASSQAVIVEKELRLALQPKVEIEEFKEGGDLSYTLSVEVMPVIEPADFSKIAVEKVVAKVGKEQTEEALKRLAEAQKTFKPAPGGHTAAIGDALKLDFAGTVDGVAFEGGAGEGVSLELGSGSFIPGFEEQLVGAKVGGHAQVNVTFPGDYTASELAGKDAVFEVDVTEIDVAEPALIDDELGKRLGLEDLAGVRTAVAEQLDRDFASISKRRVKREVLDALANLHDFEVPEGLSESEFTQIWKQIEEAREKGDVDPTDQGKSEDDLKAQYRGIAERRVRLGLLLAEVGRSNNIEVTAEEVDRAMAGHASRFPGQEREVISFYRSNPQAAEQLKGPILEDKVVDFILEVAKVTEKKISAEELLADPDVVATKAPGKKSKAKSKPKPKASAKAKTSKKDANDTRKETKSTSAAKPKK